MWVRRRNSEVVFKDLGLWAPEWSNLRVLAGISSEKGEKYYLLRFPMFPARESLYRKNDRKGKSGGFEK